MKQFTITPAAGKRLIGIALCRHPDIERVLKQGTLVIVAGTTNGYVAQEILTAIGQADGFCRDRFFRGIILPPERPTTQTGRLPDESDFPGDVVIQDGVWQRGKTIFDVGDKLGEKDVILKGANAVDCVTRRAAILIGHPRAGTLGEALLAHYGRRVRLIHPVGLEKRVSGDLADLALRVNQPGATGPRLMPAPGDIFTELDAIALMTGTEARLIAGGGVAGAEGSLWIALWGKPAQEAKAYRMLQSLMAEPPFTV